MKILVINTGSSSIKYELFDMPAQTVLAHGFVEKIGEKTGIFTHQTNMADRDLQETVGPIQDHKQGLDRAMSLLTDPENGVIKDKSEISAVGHRVVHGGETFKSSVIINKSVLSAIRQNAALAPLHNPPNLVGIEVARSVFPDAVHVAVFDTAFHQTIPKRAYMYALPLELYEKDRIRKYGFHGTSHAYVVQEAARFLGRPIERLNIITIHLGNGGSMAAVKKGKCIDTTMGMTPLAGLVMGSRCGDLDPAIPSFLASSLGMSLEEIEGLLNTKSGLKGLCGTNDMRELIAKIEGGDQIATDALDIYTYRIKKYIGAYLAAMGCLHCVVFTAGIGENSPLVRKLCCSNMEGLDIAVDEDLNNSKSRAVRRISVKPCPVKVLVVPTNEEKMIAMETERVIKENINMGEIK